MKIPVRPLAFVCSLLFLLAACSVREQVEECVQYALTVKAVDSEGNDLTDSGTLTCVDIYLFDETGFVRRIPTGTRSDFLFAHSKASTVTLVAWGNLNADSIESPDIAGGTPPEQAQLLLLRGEHGYDLPITDLFYSRKVIEQPSATRGLIEENLTLVLERRAAGMSIRTHNLSDRFGNSAEPCRFVVRGTSSALNFLGEPMNSDAGHVPPAVQVEGGDLYAAPFRLFPTQQGEPCMEIDLYRGDNRLCTVTTDSEDKPLCALPGQQLNVDIELSVATIRVTVTIAPWGEVNQETEM